MQETMAAASTRGFSTVRVDPIGVVLGDMNLKNVEVENVMHTLSQPQLEVAILGSDTQGCLVDPWSIPWPPRGPAVCSLSRCRLRTSLLFHVRKIMSRMRLC